MENTEPNAISLLWPAGHPGPASVREGALGSRSARDLELSTILDFWNPQRKLKEGVKSVLTGLCTDPDVIRYRQDIVEDLLALPALAAAFEGVQPVLEEMKGYSLTRGSAGRELYEVTYRLSELENYADCIVRLDNAFAKTDRPLLSMGLNSLKDSVARIRADESFTRMVRELPVLIRSLRDTRAVTVGINLDHNLLPVQATLLSVESERFSGASASIFNKLFPGEKNRLEGIAQLHSVPVKEVSSGSIRASLNPFDYEFAVNPMMVPLFKDLSEVLKRISVPVARALKNYVAMKSQFLTGLGEDLSFYLSAVRMIRALRDKGLSLCRPQIAPMDARVCEVKAAYNLNLAVTLLRKGELSAGTNPVVTNDLSLGEGGRIIILTGPNRGGKTTYTQSVGLIQVLAQAGLFIPGESAVISPVDRILTHFPVEEEIDKGTGRFGDEARRLNEVFDRVTRHSLVLLNESLSSTNVSESLYIARDIVTILGNVGARVLYATHMHELASAADEINSRLPAGEKVLSLVSIVSEEPDPDDPDKTRIRRTFRIVQGPPMGKSYAREIATRYGVSYEQLTEQLKKRDVL
jgi:DNA mismatch repair protein MutS